MLGRKWYTLAVVVVVAGSLLLPACAPREVIRTVEVTVPPEEMIVQVEVTSPPEVVEVTVEVTVEVPAEEERAVGAGCTFNAYRMGWVMDYADPENMLNVVFHPDSGFHWTAWDDQTYRDLVDQALLEPDLNTRTALWQQAEDILMTEDVAVIPIYHYDLSTLVRPGVETVFPPFGAPPIKHWRLPEGQTVLRYQLERGAIHLDPGTTDSTSLRIKHQLMDALYEYDAEGRIQPAGAVSYQVSEDGLVYTIKLRENATWSDGEPVIAQHYVDGILSLLNPDPDFWTGYAWMMYVIQGAEQYDWGESNDPSTVGVRAIDDYTLEITLAQAASYFDSILAFSTTFPVRLDVIEQHGDLWTQPGNFVGNGAYVLTEWTEKHLVLEKNLDYWGAGDVTIEHIEFPIIVDVEMALAAYERGELDVSDYPSGEQPRILEELPDHFVRLPHPGTYYIGLHFLRPPTDNLNFRKALATSVDKWAILDDVLHTPWRIAACGVVPPQVPGYRGCGQVGYQFDPEAAQAYLQAYMDEMGIDDPFDISVFLWYNRGNDDVMEAVAEHWRDNLGIEVAVTRMDWDAYTGTLSGCGNWLETSR